MSNSINRLQHRLAIRSHASDWQERRRPYAVYHGTKPVYTRPRRKKQSDSFASDLVVVLVILVTYGLVYVSLFYS